MFNKHAFTAIVINLVFVTASLQMIIADGYPMDSENYNDAQNEWKATMDAVQTAEADSTQARADVTQINAQTDHDRAEQAEVHVVSIFDPAIYNLYAWYTPDCETMTYVKCYEKNIKKPVKEVSVSIAQENKSIILVLVAYQPINWTIKHNKETVIKKIILGGCCEQHIMGVNGETREAFSHNPYNTSDPSIEKNIEKFTTQWLSSYQESYSKEYFYIGNSKEK